MKLSSLHFSLQTIETILCPLYWREAVPWLTIELDTSSSTSLESQKIEINHVIIPDVDVNDNTTDNIIVSIPTDKTFINENDEHFEDINASRRLSLRTRGFFHVSMSALKIECSTDRFKYDEILIESLRKGD